MATVSKRRDRYVLDYYDHQGKRQRLTMPKGTTLKAAKEQLRKIEDDLSRGSYIPLEKISNFDQIAKDWLKKKKLNVRKSTWEMYDGLLRNHFDSVNTIQIKKLTAKRIENFIIEKQTNGMNISTLRRIITTFNQVMRYAARHHYISYNPFVDVERPKDQGEPEDTHLIILEGEEIQKLLAAMTTPKYKTLIHLAIFSGAREGELLGLQWPDIDWDKNQIHIQRTFNKGEWYRVKTKKSNRRIDLGPVMMKELKEWKLACPPSGLDLVFPNENGNPVDAKNMLHRHFKPALKKAGLKDMRFHDIRHIYASLLIDQNENPKYIQEQLGHSSIQITFDIYGHLMKKTNQASAAKLEEKVFKS